MTTLCTFNANNLFVRYRFGQTFPGDMSGKSAVTAPSLGYCRCTTPTCSTSSTRCSAT
jgi:hypothetical protein